jgi:hypothetical protein
MPSVSKAQRRLFAIAEHHPEALYDRNKGVANMSKADLHDYATTSEGGLPYRQHKKSKPKKRKVYGEK